MTREPDGQATGCKPVEVGSTPTRVSAARLPGHNRADVAADGPILDLAARLARYRGGGTDCSLPLLEADARHRGRAFAGCVLVSDTMSWIGAGRHGSTATLTAWHEFVKNQVGLHPAGFEGPKLVCIDLQPYGSTRVPDRSDVLNVGGFSDAVFSVVAGFLGGRSRLVEEVEAVEL